MPKENSSPLNGLPNTTNVVGRVWVFKSHHWKRRTLTAQHCKIRTLCSTQSMCCEPVHLMFERGGTGCLRRNRAQTDGWRLSLYPRSVYLVWNCTRHRARHRQFVFCLCRQLFEMAAGRQQMNQPFHCLNSVWSEGWGWQLSQTLTFMLGRVQLGHTHSQTHKHTHTHTHARKC